MSEEVASHKESPRTIPIIPSGPNPPLFLKEQIEKVQHEQIEIAALKASLLNQLCAQEASVIQHATEKREIAYITDYYTNHDILEQRELLEHQQLDEFVAQHEEGDITSEMYGIVDQLDESRTISGS